jgi:uncharacterized protein YcbK (DUF882 family)
MTDLFLSANFTKKEFENSDMANRYGIVNIMNDVQTENAKALCQNVLQPLRDKLGKPIIITSGFRSRLLNQHVNGAANSQHMKGEAADIQVVGIEIAELVNIIKDTLPVWHQLINEYDEWVHISYKKTGNNLKQILHFTRTPK